RIEVDHGLDWDPVKAVEHIKESDPAFAPFIDRVGPFRMKAAGLTGTPFESLAESIVYQQLHGKAAASILARVVPLFAPPKFPSPKELIAEAESLLRGAALSRNKLLALQDLAQKTIDGVVPASVKSLESLSDDEIVERLTEVRGIGRWTVEMLLLFRLAR